MSDNKDYISRLMELSGIGESTGPCSNCGATLCMCDRTDDPHIAPHKKSDDDERPSDFPEEFEELEEEMARDNDFGLKPMENELEEYDGATSNVVQNPERRFSMRGDNPIVAERFNKLVDQYADYLLEFSNDAGMDSPLTANDRNEFIHDPFKKEPTTNGSYSPFSTVEIGYDPRRGKAFKSKK